MFLGGMIMGPFAGWVLQKVDDALEDNIPVGFEMLVNNFSLGILGTILAMLGVIVVGPFVSGVSSVAASSNRSSCRASSPSSKAPPGSCAKRVGRENKLRATTRRTGSFVIIRERVTHTIPINRVLATDQFAKADARRREIPRNYVFNLS